MDRLFARRLEREPEFRQKFVKLVKDYLRVGRDALSYWSSDFDTAYDLLACYSPLNKQDFDRLEKGHPKRFILPMTATQITTMTTYVAQVLFGQDAPHKVEGRGAEDETPAEFINQLLRWNAEQQPTYAVGYLWCQDAIAVNRGIFYNSWQPIFRPEIKSVEVADPEDKDPVTGQPRTYSTPRRVNKLVGGYNRAEIVSPYDFVCDPSLPLLRLQEHRFAGHRTVIPVTELERRSKLSPDHPAYIFPWAITELKEKVKKGGTQADPVPSVTGGAATNPNEIRLSRTAYERTRANNPTGADQANKQDSGNAECWELWVKLTPTDYEIHDGSEPSLFQVLVGAGDVLLSISESTYAHGMLPYSVGEGRPNAHFQFSPGWVGMLKGIQDHIDWLKNRHQEALSRTIGNVFLLDPSAVDVSDFMNPDKEGLLITLKPEAFGKKLGDVFQQVPIKDMTEGFQEEAMMFVRFSESVTAANSSMQGVQSQEQGSATEYAGTQQMSAGRMTSIARLLSSQALVPQTRQFVSNFQQFLDQPQTVRFQSSSVDLPPELQRAKSLVITKDTIQGEYDYIAHDGTLPGTDGRKVAAITRLLEGAAAFPDMFSPAPGNLDPRKLILAGAKASGLNTENFLYDAAALPQPPAPPADPMAAALPPVELPGMATAPGPKPAAPSLPALDSLSLPALDLPQARPANS